MAETAASMQREESPADWMLDLWKELSSMLSKSISDFNGICGEEVWCISIPQGPLEPVEVRSRARAQDSVEVAFRQEPARVVCRFGAQVQRDSLEFEFRPGLVPGLAHLGSVISPSVAADMILTPLTTGEAY